MHVLVSAYACEPGRGSEPGVGWAWVELISTFARVTVVTRANNQRAIDEAATESEWVNNVRWVYHDLPQWSRTLKRRSGLVQPYYAAWQRSARKVLQTIVSSEQVDLVHHLTFGTYWMPYATDSLGVPVLIGPVGGAEAPPVAFVVDDAGAFVYEASRYVARALSERLPMVRRPVRSAALCVAKAQETERRLAVMGAQAVALRSEVVMPETMRVKPVTSREHRALELVSLSRLVHLKGIQLALRGIAEVRARLPEFRYTLVGDGPYRSRLESLVRDLNLSDVVRFVGEVPRDVALSYLEEADLFIHPSLHDSGGWACIEAMWSGVPVVCLDIGGPANQVVPSTGRRVALTSPRETAKALGAALLELGLDPDTRAAMGVAAQSRVEEEYSHSQQREWLLSVYGRIVEGDQAP